MAFKGNLFHPNSVRIYIQFWCPVTEHAIVDYVFSFEPLGVGAEKFNISEEIRSK